jgi:integrase
MELNNESQKRDWGHDEDRKAVLRRIRGGTHWSCKHLPERYKTTPEYLECIEHGWHFDTLIGFVEQGGGGMLTSNTTAAESEQITEATRRQGGPTPNELFDRWFGPWSHGKSPDTVSNAANGYTRHFRNQPTMSKPVRLIAEHEWQALILDLPMQSGGKTKWRGIIRQAIVSPLIRQGVLAYDPFDSVRLPKNKTQDEAPKGYTMEQFTRLYEAAESDQQRAYLLIGMGAGPRPNEQLMLKADDFDLDNDMLVIRRARHGAVKGGKPMPTPLLPMARQGFELCKKKGFAPADSTNRRDAPSCRRLCNSH